jgi:hypothetical protein
VVWAMNIKRLLVDFLSVSSWCARPASFLPKYIA